MLEDDIEVHRERQGNWHKPHVMNKASITMVGHM